MDSLMGTMELPLPTTSIIKLGVANTSNQAYNAEKLSTKLAAYGGPAATPTKIEARGLA
jgi:hypothetical protein